MDKKEIDQHIVMRKIEELIPADYNPRKIKAKDFEHIRLSIQRFGLVQPILVNMNPDRENIIIGGHRRVEAAKVEGYDVVPCIELNLPIDQEKELNLRLNKNTGEFDEDKFDLIGKDMLLNVGFEESELKMFMDEFEEKITSIKDSDAAYPIVPKFSEKHDAIIIISNSEIDTVFMENALDIGSVVSYKNSHTGKATIIDVNQFKKAWEQLR